MADAPNDLPLAAEFPPATQEQWRKLVDGVLKGAPFERRLVAKTYDGLAINPLYARAAGAVPIAGRAPGSPWAIMQRVDHPDPAAANAEALHDLENGATGLALVFAGSVGAYGYGLDASEATIARVLADVHLDAGIALDLDLSPQTKDAGALIAALVKRRGINPAATDIRFGFDPIGAAAVAGGSPLSWDALDADLQRGISDLAAQGFRGPFAPRGRTRDPQCRRLGGAGARLRARRRRHLSARAGNRRHRARCRPPHDLFPACRRRRPVPDHRQISRACGSCGRASSKPAGSNPGRCLSPPRPRGA